MEIISVLENKDKLLKENKTVECNNCGEKYYSPFDRLYILIKGKCYCCSTDNLFAENVLNNI